MQIRSKHRKGSRGEAPPLPFLASFELSREFVVQVSEAVHNSGRGAGSLQTVFHPLSARLAAQDGRYLSGRAHPKARNGDQGTVSGFFLYSRLVGLAASWGLGAEEGTARSATPLAPAPLHPPRSLLAGPRGPSR